MSVIAKQEAARQSVFNVPNQLSALRLLLSIVLFSLIEFEYFLASTLVFIVAAGTDWLDGYWARKYGQVTNLGRILDPFVDKIIICGTFIFLVAVPGSGIRAWMAVVVVGRELHSSLARALLYLEGEGADFSASMSGKLKMLLQCLAAALSWFSLYYSSLSERPIPLDWALLIAVYAAVALTVYSGAAYVMRAIALLRVVR